MFRRAAVRRPAPRHRDRRAPLGLSGTLRRRLVVAGTATVVGVGTVVTGAVVADAAPSQSVLVTQVSRPVDTALTARQAEERTPDVSRSADRGAVTQKLQILRAEARPGQAVTKTVDLASGDPRTIARAMLADFGWSSDQFSCLDSLWTRESNWNVHAANPTSSAYGIPQALPGSKMSTAGSDWADNPATQIRWGLGYIQGSYGSPCAAWSHSEGYGWY